MAFIGFVFLLISITGKIIEVIKMVFYIIRAIFILIFSAISNMKQKVSAQMPLDGKQTKPSSARDTETRVTAETQSPREKESTTPSVVTPETTEKTVTKPVTSRNSRRQTTSRRGVQLKADLVTQYKHEKGDNGEV